MKILTLVLCLACAAAYGQRKEFAWLVGTWQEDSKSYELWRKDGDSLFGESHQIKDGNKVVSESMKLIKKGNDFFYVLDAIGPQGPVEFKITSLDENSFVAKNPVHDFPQKIIYKRMDEHHLQAFVQKIDDTMIMRFYFTKVK